MQTFPKSKWTFDFEPFTVARALTFFPINLYNCTKFMCVLVERRSRRVNNFFISFILHYCSYEYSEVKMLSASLKTDSMLSMRIT